MAVVLAGDFNFELAQGPAAALVSSMQFHNPFRDGHRRPTTTASHFGRARSIDWILTKGPVCAVESELHDSTHASDHYPLSMTLRRI